MGGTGGTLVGKAPAQPAPRYLPGLWRLTQNPPRIATAIPRGKRLFFLVSLPPNPRQGSCSKFSAQRC